MERITTKTSVVTVASLIMAAGIVLSVPPTPTPPPCGQDQVCVNIAPSDQPRVTEAFGSILGLKDAQGNSRKATLEEISSATAQWLGGQTHDFERRANMTTFTPPPFSEGSGKMNAPTTATAPTPKAKKK